MNKVTLIFISLVFLLTACQPTNSNIMTLEELLTSFKEHHLQLKESKVSDHNIFGMKLNGGRPSSYELDGKLLLVFIYDSPKAREKGLEDFHHKTAAANLVAYNLYEANNVLLFYVHERDLSLEVEVDDKIQKAVRKLVN
ncbi:hypothetical protein WQ54_17070 [Bacillus sp. SA1-12]|uniref:hypothetical protein n=1 Tax=Bacillus sp. SA1-12 TaxID=1455638 RepID=UPI0006273373|nr:hypothetical protein [Bacillus sp. SA1-12]KKI91033.1 hypothetical protein WQ54_17070 [Bacillus sp. SA1-12]